MTTITIRDLLPPSATALERAADIAAGSRIDPLPAPRPWDPWTCPPQLLPALAWGLSVDEWDDAWPVEVQRAVCAASLPVHARKGTVVSVRQALQAAGLVIDLLGWTAHIVKGITGLRHDGSAGYDGSRDYGSDMSWASYQVILNRPITLAQSASARRLLDATVPARCTLAEFLFTAAAWLYNGQPAHDGTITYGAA